MINFIKKPSLFISIFSIVYSSCSNENFLGAGYRWDLFKNTVNWNLAKAVAREDTAEIYSIVKNGKVNINLQETKFGKTLLMLSVGNDKELSTAALLKMGADVNLRDDRDDQPIHEAVSYINLKQHSYNILKLLLFYHADVNSISKNGTNPVPLAGAVEDFSCAKLLLDNGANIYYRNNDSDYVVWSSLSFGLNDNLLVAKYLIIEKKTFIPNPILYTFPNHEPRDFYELLELLVHDDNSKKQRIKEDIINYLHKINFPKNQVYQENIQK